MVTIIRKKKLNKVFFIRYYFPMKLYQFLYLEIIPCVDFKCYFLLKVSGDIGLDGLKLKIYKLKKAFKMFHKIIKRFHFVKTQFSRIKRPVVEKFLKPFQWIKQNLRKKPTNIEANKLFKPNLIRNINSNEVKCRKELLDLIIYRIDVNQISSILGGDISTSIFGNISKKTILECRQILSSLKSDVYHNNRRSIRFNSGRFFAKIPHIFNSKSSLEIDDNYKIYQNEIMLDALSKRKKAEKIRFESRLSLSDLYEYKLRSWRYFPNLLIEDNCEYEMVKNYFENSQSFQHIYQFTICLYKIYKLESNEKFKKNLKNRFYLWHGSRNQTIEKILEEGFKKSPGNGMLGRGVYFAEMSSKAIQFSWTDYEVHDHFILLCEVALGNYKKIFRLKDYTSTSHHKIKGLKSKKSIKCLGRCRFSPTNYFRTSSNVIIPSGEHLVSENKRLVLNFDEYCVSNVKRIIPRYLVHSKVFYN